ITACCTFGLRLEALTVVVANRGFKELYHLDGGIVRYGEACGDNGLWEGSLYVYGDRMRIDFSDDAKVIGSCQLCSAPCAELRNCTAAGCKTLAVVCQACHDQQPDRVCATCAADTAEVNS